MSWSVRWTQENGEIGDQSFSELEGMLSHIVGNKPHLEQYDAATAAASVLIASGAVGNPKGKFLVVLSGHGNEGHAPDAGWANDAITVQVSQL